MNWVVELHEDFESEFEDLPEVVQDEILTISGLLQKFGSQLSRPKVGTLKGSQYSNMKELRFNAADGVWRVAFAFDTQRCAILLVAGDKSGVSQNNFYKKLIKKADTRFKIHLSQLKSGLS